MPILSNPAFGARTALGYVTAGALLCVWTLVWYFTRDADAEALTRTQKFLLFGLLLTGITFILLGLFLGPLGRAARAAELPPTEAMQAEANIQQIGAAHPPAVAAGVPGAVGAAAPAANPAVPVQPAAQPTAPPAN